MAIILVVIAFIIIFIIGIAYSTLSWGLVMYKFWYWFLLPVFPDMPHINFIAAIGLILFVSLFHTTHTQILKKEYKEETQTITLPIITPWITLIIGWLVHTVMPM